MSHGHTHDKHNQHRRADRRWDMHQTIIDQKRINCRRIFCATAGCGQQGELLDRTFTGYPPALVETKFKQKGWEVGRDSSGDFCPSCVKTADAARRAKRVKAINVHLAPEAPAIATSEEPMPAMNGTEPPMTMSRADRRIIFAAIEDHYLDEDRGYRDGWSDSAVAKSLGDHIPLAWVALVREENFGPVKDNGEVRDMILRVRAALEEAASFVNEARALRAEGGALVERVNSLCRQATEIGKKIDGLQATADRIEKYVS